MDNPVIPWQHGLSTERQGKPVANGIELGLDTFQNRRCLIGTAKFWDDEFSTELFEHYASGRLRGWSVRCDPVEASPPTAQERRHNPDWGKADLIYRKLTLIEVSAVSIPGNASTLTLSVERSLHGAGSRMTHQLMGNPLGLDNQGLNALVSLGMTDSTAA
jgi:hypothetical protein